jgi:hypothetical protein
MTMPTLNEEWDRLVAAIGPFTPEQERHLKTFYIGGAWAMVVAMEWAGLETTPAEEACNYLEQQKIYCKEFFSSLIEELCNG